MAKKTTKKTAAERALLPTTVYVQHSVNAGESSGNEDGWLIAQDSLAGDHDLIGEYRLVRVLNVKQKTSFDVKEVK